MVDWILLSNEGHVRERVPMKVVTNTTTTTHVKKNLPSNKCLPQRHRFFGSPDFLKENIVAPCTTSLLSSELRTSTPPEELTPHLDIVHIEKRLLAKFYRRKSHCL